jgi:hypothetical protein
VKVSIGITSRKSCCKAWETSSSSMPSKYIESLKTLLAKVTGGTYQWLPQLCKENCPQVIDRKQDVHHPGVEGL